MYFIGSGALLTHAIVHARAAGLSVAGACCAPGDPAGARLRSLGIAVLDSADPNAEAEAIARAASDGIVFSINNRHLLGDALLRCGPRFFNIHNGLTQHYRGIAEICLFAALCRGESRYGVTLQELLPAQRVDSGPVVAQLDFAIAPEDNFARVLENSLQACRALFEQQAAVIASGAFSTQPLQVADRALSYRDVPALAAQAEPARLQRACALGRYAGLFPALRAAIAALPPR